MKKLNVEHCIVLIALLVATNLFVPLAYGEIIPRQIELHKECPLCGMYPARYIDFQCQVVFADGRYEAFDSPAGLLVYLLFPDKTGITYQSPVKVFFKDFIAGKWISGEESFFVVGTGVMGPMGIDFLPVSGEKRAEALKLEEKGELIISFDKVDRQFMTKAANSNWLHFLARKIVLQ